MALAKIRLPAGLLMIFALQYGTYLFSDSFEDRLIKLGSLALIVLISRFRSLNHSFRKTLLLYGLLLGSALFASVASADFTGVSQWLKFVMQFAPLPVILFTYVDGREVPKNLITAPFPWALLISIQSSILFSMIYLGIAPNGKFHFIERLGNMDVVSFGIWGFGNAIASTSYGDELLRAQSWFVEPSKLSAFLIYPCLVSWSIFRMNRRLYYLAVACLSGICLLLTFSLAGIFGLIGGVCFLLFVRPRPDNPHRVAPATVFKPMLAVLSVVFLASFVLNQATGMYQDRDATRFTKVFARDPTTQTLLRETSRLPAVVEVLRSRTFGIGLGATLGHNETTSPNAFIFWAVAGGVPAIIALILIYGHLMLSFCMPALQSGYPPHRAIGAAFIGISIQQLSYGTWMEPLYLIVVGTMILAGRAAASGLK